MALSNELSSEIAAALLSTTDKSPRELKDLQEVVFKIHSTLTKMDHQAQASRLRSIARSESRAATSNS